MGSAEWAKTGDGPSWTLPACLWALVAFELALEAVVGVAAAALAASLLRSDQ
jgi:predicted amidohydrolase